jgi:hypothetical protein
VERQHDRAAPPPSTGAGSGLNDAPASLIAQYDACGTNIACPVSVAGVCACRAP